MRVIGFNFDKVSAEKKKELKGKFQIKSNIDFISMEKADIPFIKDETVLKFTFSFKINYNPGLAEIILNGFILAVFENKQASEILKKWKSKKLVEEIRPALFNLILTKCSLKAVLLEEELNLPSHLPLPRLVEEEQKKNYVD